MDTFFQASVRHRDLDEVFAYSTAKLVWIRDRWIGLIYYTLVFFALFWVFGVEILWGNQHFRMLDVHGFARMRYERPTALGCEAFSNRCQSAFRSAAHLPYCEVDNETHHKGGRRRNNRNNWKAQCKFLDEVSLTQEGSGDNTLFIPTAVEVMTETRVCNPSIENGDHCQDEYVPSLGSNCLQQGKYLCDTHGNRSKQFYYVADVSKFKIQFTSNYEREGIRGVSLMLPSYVGSCESVVQRQRKPRTWTERNGSDGTCAGKKIKLTKMKCAAFVNCVEKRAFDILEDTGINQFGKKLKSALKLVATGAEGPNQTGLNRSTTSHAGIASHGSNGSRILLQTRLGALQASAAEEGDPVNTTIEPEYSSTWGDVFEIGRLLQLAGADLDNDYNQDGWTTRQAGTVVEVVAVYSNLYPFLSSLGYMPVKYHYEVRETLMPYVTRVQLAFSQPADYPASRSYEVRYGILVKFKVEGQFGFFNGVYLILVVCSALTLLATARTVTDLIVLYFHSKGDFFFHMKYEVTPDVSDMWQCPTCGYMNRKEDEFCKGVPKFSHPTDTQPCGASSTSTSEVAR